MDWLVGVPDARGFVRRLNLAPRRRPSTQRSRPEREPRDGRGGGSMTSTVRWIGTPSGYAR